MADKQIEALKTILSEADTFLRQRLKAAGIEVAHVLLTVDDDGVGMIRSNVGPDDLLEMAELLGEIAEEAGGMEPQQPH